MAVGILALQGAFAEHAAVLDRLGVPHFEIRQKRDLEQPMDRLILPGGESTVMRKLLGELDLFEPLRQRIADGMPVFGTCAGLILLAKQVDGGTPCFATMDISVKRNRLWQTARQLSHRADLWQAGHASHDVYPRAVYRGCARRCANFGIGKRQHCRRAARQTARHGISSGAGREHGNS